MSILSEKVEILFNSINIISSKSLYIFPSIKEELLCELNLDSNTEFYDYNAPLFKELKNLVDKYLTGCDLIYLNLADEIQAIAYQSNENDKVICIYRGTVNAIWNLCYQYCFDYDFYYTNSKKYAKTMNKKETHIYLFNYLVKLSLMFVILHEVGHLKLGHILKIRNITGGSLLLEFPKNLKENNTSTDTIELQKLEIEADIFAAQKFINMLDELVSSVNKKILGGVGYIEAINFIIFSISIILIHWQVISRQTGYDQDHPISLERLLAIVTVIGLELYKNPKIMNVYTEYIKNNIDIRNFLESDLKSDLDLDSKKMMDVFDNNENIHHSGLGRILGLQTMIMIKSICEIQGVTMPQILAAQLNLLNKLGF